MIIRRCHTSDLDACANLLIDVYSEKPYYGKWTCKNAISYLERFLHIDPENCFVAVTDNHLSGAIFAFSYPWQADKLICIQELFVSGSARTRGIASQLIAHLNNGMQIGAWIVAHEKSTAALVYSKKGFSQDGPYRFWYGRINT